LVLQTDHVGGINWNDADMNEKINLMIFASGSGSNAENLIKYFAQHPHVKVGAVVCNNPLAGVLAKATALNVETLLVTNQEVSSPGFLVDLCNLHETGLIVLAGFLRKIPADLIRQYPERIINLHPALLPAHGGKGMYGMYVHQAVIEAEEEISGISIHLVNENYDDGRILAQFKTQISKGESPESLAQKIHLLEQQFLPQVVDDYAKSLLKKS
jgi:phosphoribosylglycinamide formyltransferase-1